jgi:HNH endonuclease
VRKSEGCWEWTGGTNGHYGVIGLGGRGGGCTSSHRMSWRIHYGVIPDEMQVLHHCDNTLCVRPDHLFVGTRSDNMRDMVKKGRQPTAVHPGLFSGARNPNAGLTAEQVSTMRAKHAEGASVYELSDEYGLTRSGILAVLTRRTWKNIA